MYQLKTTTIYLKCSQFCGSAVWAGFSWMILLVSSGFTNVSAITVVGRCGVQELADLGRPLLSHFLAVLCGH